MSDDRAGTGGRSPRRRLHPRPPRERAALPHLAHRRELGGPPGPPPAAGPGPARRGLRTGHHHRRPGRPGRPRAGGGHRPVRRRGGPGRGRLRGPVPTAEVRVADVYALPFDDASFDVVHAHQVLQHLSDPVAALREMRRVCRPDGVVAVRDADYEAFSWAPADPALDAWLALYRAVARGNGADPDAGRHLKGWARAAGFSHVEATASAWCFATDEERTWWGELWAERTTATALADQATAAGLATPADLDAMAAAFRRWAADPDAVFLVPHGEVLARP